jgi:hypothetical protein
MSIFKKALERARAKALYGYMNHRLILCLLFFTKLLFFSSPKIASAVSMSVDEQVSRKQACPQPMCLSEDYLTKQAMSLSMSASSVV